MLAYGERSAKVAQLPFDPKSWTLLVTAYQLDGSLIQKDRATGSWPSKEQAEAAAHRLGYPLT